MFAQRSPLVGKSVHLQKGGRRQSMGAIAICVRISMMSLQLHDVPYVPDWALYGKKSIGNLR